MTRLFHCVSFFLVAFMCFCTVLQAQVTPVQNEVVLYSGERFSGVNLSYNSPILQPSSFQLDDKNFESSEVAFFRNYHGYFANLNKLYNDRAERYAMRIKEGKINLFEEVEFEVYAEQNLAVTEGEDNEMLATNESFQYFNKGDGAVQKANYKNLRLALADNAESKQEMNVFRNFRYAQIGLVVAGAGILAYEMVRQNEAANTSSDESIRFTPMVALGLVLGGSSYLLERPKQDAKWFAVDNYNK
ncbi:MAG: hypothetical protein ACK5W1_02980 [Flavobacteriales bacterium]|jgi:hypothetical protein